MLHVRACKYERVSGRTLSKSSHGSIVLQNSACHAASTNGSERLRSNDSAALGTALIALDTDGAGEEEW